MDDHDTDRGEATSSWLLGLIDGVTGAMVLATIGAIYALLMDMAG
jgi:hypothetical protein